MSGKHDFTIEQGVRFTKVVTWKTSSNAAVDLTGMTGRMQIRTRDGDPIKTLADGSGLTLGGTAGTVTLVMTDAETKALNFDTAIYDIEISQSGQVIKRLLKGIVTLDHEVTQDA